MKLLFIGEGRHDIGETGASRSITFRPANLAVKP